MKKACARINLENIDAIVFIVDANLQTDPQRLERFSSKLGEFIKLLPTHTRLQEIFSQTQLLGINDKKGLLSEDITHD